MLIDNDIKILVQGITGREATMMTEDMIAYGSDIVAGVTPGKGGQEVHGVPVYNTVAEAVKQHKVTTTVIAVPPPAVLGAALEAIYNGIKLCLIMTERLPRLDSSKLIAAAKEKGCCVIGPNSMGMIRPGIAKLGTVGGRIDNVKKSFSPGRVAILSRSGGMTSEIASFLTSRGIGQSVAIGLGGDPIVGADFTELIELLEQEDTTDSVILYAEPGGTAEERLAKHLIEKPSRFRINAFFGGSFVDKLEGIRFGHASVIVENGCGSVISKKTALREAGVFVADAFDDITEGLK